MPRTHVNVNHKIIRIVAAVMAVTFSMMPAGAVVLAADASAASANSPDNNGWQ